MVGVERDRMRALHEDDLLSCVTMMQWMLMGAGMSEVPLSVELYVSAVFPYFCRMDIFDRQVLLALPKKALRSYAGYTGIVQSPFPSCCGSLVHYNSIFPILFQGNSSIPSIPR